MAHVLRRTQLTRQIVHGQPASHQRPTAKSSKLLHTAFYLYYGIISIVYLPLLTGLHTHARRHIKVGEHTFVVA